MNPRPGDHIYAPNGVVVGCTLASQAGIYVLQEGGTATDAAVAALGVSCVLGMAERAPDISLSGLVFQPQDGHPWELSADKPEIADIVATLQQLVGRFGTRSFYDLVRPALTYAESSHQPTNRTWANAFSDSATLSSRGVRVSEVQSLPPDNRSGDTRYVVGSDPATRDGEVVHAVAVDHRGCCSAISVGNHQLTANYEIVTRDGQLILVMFGESRAVIDRIHGLIIASPAGYDSVAAY